MGTSLESAEVRESTMAQQIAKAANAFQQQLTGHEPKSVSVVLSGDTLVITLHGALSPAEQRGEEPAAARCRSFTGSCFTTHPTPLRQEIKRITGMDVREATTEVEPRPRSVVQVFTNGTTVQVFLLSGSVPSGNFDDAIKK